MNYWKNLKYRLLTKGAGFYINVLALFKAQRAASLAYALFSVPREGKLLAFTPFLEKAQKKTLSFQEYKIQTYQWPNDGETILLIHGWESNSNRWQGLIQYFKKKKNYNIISLDAPGQGMSSGKELNPILYSQFIHEVCKEFKPDYLIGHSLGGLTMFYYQSQYQFPSVKKVIGLASPNRFSRITNNYQKLLSLSKTSFHHYISIFKDRFEIDINRFNTEFFVENIDQPILIIHDKNDLIVPYEDALEITEKNPEVTFIPTENLGHSLYNQNVYKNIIGFLERKDV